ncbi:MAG: CAP domain-containing protein [Myxococcales bacterium]|nr:CAP domain-containing protein [Myxococcales bacterium]
MSGCACWFTAWLLAQANAAEAEPALPAPTEVLAELNRLRQDPRGFAPGLEEWLSWFDGSLLRRPGEMTLRTREGKTAVEEALAFLAEAKAAPSLHLSPGMSRAALEHATDLGTSGETGHTGSDGSNPSQRLRRYGTWRGKVGENLAFGESAARRVIQLLLVDDGVPDRSHRQSLLERRFGFVGIACAPHPVYRVVCVIDLATTYEEKEPSLGSPSEERKP